MTASGPLLVYGPRSLDYDFGPGHPLTPRRFAPGLDLLRELGAVPGLAPEPADDVDLELVHQSRYIAQVRRFSANPWQSAAVGIARGGDVPPFYGMHEAAAAVAGGSLRAVEAILDGEVEHAYHPGGGLHHAMPGRASGFCIYNDVAMAIAVARRAGLRVLYVDLDVHHGDGVEAIHRSDSGVMTVSFHESGRYLFPGTGVASDVGEGTAGGTVVNLPFEPGAGEAAWLGAVSLLIPGLAASFGPDLIVSQHGADSHAFDPLAHLRVTTTAMGAAARLLDVIAHRYADGRWLATGGGGYEVYRVVPRAWALTWLAAAHREPAEQLPARWRRRWLPDVDRRSGDRDTRISLPTAFDDPPNAGLPRSSSQKVAERAAAEMVDGIQAAVLPRLLVIARERGWCSPEDRVAPQLGRIAAPEDDGRGAPQIITEPDAATLERLRPVRRLGSIADSAVLRAALIGAARAGGRVAAALSGDRIVGLAVAVGDPGPPTSTTTDGAGEELVALGVSPARRRRGLATALLGALYPAGLGAEPAAAQVGSGERDVVDPLPIAERRAIAVALLGRAGFVRSPASDGRNTAGVDQYRRS